MLSTETKETKQINFLHIIILLHPVPSLPQGILRTTGGVQKKLKITVLWPHTKTLVPAEAGYEFSVEM